MTSLGGMIASPVLLFLLSYGIITRESSAARIACAIGTGAMLFLVLLFEFTSFEGFPWRLILAAAIVGAGLLVGSRDPFD